MLGYASEEGVGWWLAYWRDPAVALELRVWLRWVRDLRKRHHLVMELRLGLINTRLFVEACIIVMINLAHIYQELSINVLSSGYFMMV